MSAGAPWSSDGYLQRNRVQLVQGGAPFFKQLVEHLDQARHHIHFQVYIFETDGTGRMVVDALLRARQRQVEVFLLLDGYASQSLEAAWIDELQAAGVHFRWFNPLFKTSSYYFGRRLHHKVMVFDALHALVTGVNISDRYNDLPGQPAWLDYGLLVTGETAFQLHNLCSQRWNKGRPGHLPEARLFYNPALSAVTDVCPVRIRRNDWVSRKIEITRSYLEMLRKARKELYIMSSYFLPGRLIRTHLTRAAKRGVSIHIVIAGRSDVPIAKAAERYWYPFLLRNNIHIYEYQPRILHAKLSAYDDEFVTVGSYNVNQISAYASVELNLDVKESAFASATIQQLRQIIQHDCVEITATAYSRSQTWLHRLYYWCAYELYRLIFFVFTFYLTQKKKE